MVRGASESDTNMKYQFNLEWDELPEELREEKIKEYILKETVRDCDDCDGEGKKDAVIPAHQEAGKIVDESEASGDCPTCEGTGNVDPDPEDLHQQEKAEESIKAHFPIYF